MFDNLYSFNSTLFIVTSNPSSIPERSLILSNGLPLTCVFSRVSAFPQTYYVSLPQGVTKYEYTD